MANEPHFRDLSKLEFLPNFNGQIVVRIDKCSVVCAALAGLFGILYFSLAPGARFIEYQSSTDILDGYNCNMLSSLWRSYSPFYDVITQAAAKRFNDDNLFDNLKSLKRPGTILDISNAVLSYEGAHFDTYSDCLSAAKTTCTLRNTDCRYSPSSPYCQVRFDCTSLNGALVLKPAALDSCDCAACLRYEMAMNLLANYSLGKCSPDANISACSGIIEHCETLENARAVFEHLL